MRNDCVGHARNGAHVLVAGAVTECVDGGLGKSDTHVACAPVRAPRRRKAQEPLTPEQREDAIALIQAQWRNRQAWHQAEKAQTLRAKAMCRRLAEEGDKKEADRIYKAALGEGEHPMASMAMAIIVPFIEARGVLEGYRKPIEKEIERTAKRFLIADWVKETPGFSFNALGAILGEAGDIGSYANPGKLWKRFGLAPFRGAAASTLVRGSAKAGMTKDDWSDLGYKPARRSVMYVIGDALIGGMGHGPRPMVGEDIEAREDWSPYQKLFVSRLRHEAEREPAMRLPDTKEGKESYPRHAFMRAKRYVEKRFLRDLWREWRRLDGIEESPRGDGDVATQQPTPIWEAPVVELSP